MYHTEGFVNKHSIDYGKHIIMLSLEQHKHPWYVWCVSKKAIAEPFWLQQVLSFWLQQTLLTNGICDVKYAQRELNRLGGYLQNMDSAKIKVEDIRLFMYYQGAFFRWESERMLKNNAIYDSNLYREISKGVYGYVSEEGLWDQYNKKPHGDALLAEELANKWELGLLEACESGKVEEGFFFIWEDSVGF